MSLPLPQADDNITELVFNHINNLCPPDVKLILGDRLENILSSFFSNTNRLDVESVKRIMKDNFDIKIFKSPKEKSILFQIEVILKAAIVHFLSFREDTVFDKFSTIEELVYEYPSFKAKDVDETELQFLLIYRNMMKIALRIIPPKCNKRLLMSICSTLECSGKSYTTGGTQSMSTTRRVMIYEQESAMKPTKRAGRKTAASPKAAKTYGSTACPCGSVILVRTMWKHRKSKKHVTYLQRLKQSGQYLGSEENFEDEAHDEDDDDDNGEDEEDDNEENEENVGEEVEDDEEEIAK